MDRRCCCYILLGSPTTSPELPKRQPEGLGTAYQILGVCISRHGAILTDCPDIQTVLLPRQRSLPRRRANRLAELQALSGGGLGYGFSSSPKATIAENNPSQPVPTKMVDAVADPVGGYIGVTAQGSVYNFGSAPWSGSPVAQGIVPGGGITAITRAPSGGYWLLAAQGSIYNYGGARWYGSPLSQFHAPPAYPTTALIPTPGGGYWIMGTAGSIYNYGGAPWYGSAFSSRMPTYAVGIMTTALTTKVRAPSSW